jgi:hypothetical protein
MNAGRGKLDRNIDASDGFCLVVGLEACKDVLETVVIDVSAVSVLDDREKFVAELAIDLRQAEGFALEDTPVFRGSRTGQALGISMLSWLKRAIGTIDREEGTVLSAIGYQTRAVATTV